MGGNGRKSDSTELQERGDGGSGDGGGGGGGDYGDGGSGSSGGGGGGVVGVVVEQQQQKQKQQQQQQQEKKQDMIHSRGIGRMTTLSKYLTLLRQEVRSGCSTPHTGSPQSTLESTTADCREELLRDNL